VSSKRSLRLTTTAALRNQSGRLVVTPEAALGSDAFSTVLVALAGCAQRQMIVDLTYMSLHDAALLAVREARCGSAEPTCDIRLVDERPGARRRINRLRGGHGLPVYATVEFAIGACE